MAAIRSPRLHILLYAPPDFGGAEFQHAALTVTREDNIPQGHINVFQINRSQQTNEWVLMHLAVDLRHSVSFACSIRLPPFAWLMSQADLEEYLQDFPPVPDPGAGDKVEEWDCVRWCLRAVKTLAEEGAFQDEQVKRYFSGGDMVYNQIMLRGQDCMSRGRGGTVDLFE